MSDQFLAEIRVFGCNFAPVGWLQCNGQILPISQYTALFSLLGTNFGGNGTSTFGLPNLQASVPIAAGNGPGLTPRVVGESGGETTITLLQTEMPIHTHAVQATTTTGTTATAASSQLAFATAGGGKGGAAYVANFYSSNTGKATTALLPTAIPPQGGNLPHNNVMPYLALNFCIAISGIFPSRG
jgi:microcystin-dependent protein